MKTVTIAATLSVVFQLAAANAQLTTAIDPTIGYSGLFGLGGRSCKQYDDTGRLFIYSEGLPSPGIISWLQRSDNGTKANVPMPDELVAALPLIPGCLPGKHHAPQTSGTASVRNVGDKQDAETPLLSVGSLPPNAH